MSIILRDDPCRAALLSTARPTELVISVAAEAPADAPMVGLRVSVRDSSLGRRIKLGMTRRLRAVVAEPLPDLRVVRISSRKAFDGSRDDVTGAIAIVRVTDRNRGGLESLVESLVGAGAAGVQLAWDGRDPPRERVEAGVFAVLEQARLHPGRAPVVLAPGEEVVESLRILARVSER